MTKTESFLQPPLVFFSAPITFWSCCLNVTLPNFFSPSPNWRLMTLVGNFICALNFKTWKGVWGGVQKGGCFELFQKRPWFKFEDFRYITSVGIGEAGWMRCLTFSDLSPGSEFAGGCQCREQRCVELSLSLFQTPPTWSPTCLPSLPPLMGEEEVHLDERGKRWRGWKMEWEVAVGVALTLSTAQPRTENYRFHLGSAEEKQRRVTL